jgi:hypothetical protein
MNITDRIDNIKKILYFCVNQEINFFDDKCGEFLSNLLVSKGEHEPYYKVYTIGLFLSSVSKNPTIFLKYAYEKDYDTDTNFLLFHDENASYDYGEQYGTVKYELEYTDIPDEMWEIIQICAENKAKTDVELEMKSAQRQYEYAKDNLNNYRNAINNLKRDKYGK